MKKILLMPFILLINADFGYYNSELPKLEKPNIAGYPYDFFMPLNKSVFGNFSFNGGWTNGGLTIQDGDIYAQTGYFYNLTSLNVSYQNLTVNEDAYYLGSVGIGTTTPDYALDVAGDIGINQKLIHNGDENTYLEFLNDQVIMRAGNVRLQDWVEAGQDKVIINTGNTDVDFEVRWDSGVSMFSEGSSGNVGIGTTNPDELMHIKQTADDFTTLHLESTNAGTGSGSQIQLTSDTGNNWLINHGTGRTASRYGLTLGGWMELLVQENSANGLVLGTGTRDDPIVFGNNNLERMRVDAGGNVGIGTSTPQNTLNVLGDGNFTSNLIIGTPAVPQNITMYSPDGTAFSCGVNNAGEWGCI